MAKLPLPSGISWLCHFAGLRPGVAHCSRRCVPACRRLAAGSACVCFSKGTLFVVKYGRVPVSRFVFLSLQKKFALLNVLEGRLHSHYP